ncbi:MAG: hypothetical protein LC672_02910 [Acidobacteria bacterium]|nr:hypothetical protein [Acidobacteriota bacterium]
MADYRDKLDEWREAARRKARELDERYGIKERVEEGARAAQEAARKGAEAVAEGAERVRSEAGRMDDSEVGAQARQAAEEATRAARAAGERVRAAAGTAGEKAGEVFGEARHYYDRASEFYHAGARLTRATGAVTTGALKAYNWARANPGRAALVSLSLVVGTRLGASFPGLDAVFLGAHPHWLTHSALPVWALRKAGEKFDSYLREREGLIAEGRVSEAERKRAEFERQIVRYVGAPLLGAFSCATGAVLWAQIFQPGRITGAPISWLLGGNPVLDAVWLFANGIVCFQQGYKFFMIALADQKDAERIVRELKGLLPSATVAEG